LDDQRAERKEPESPENIGKGHAVTVQAEEEEGEGFAMSLVEGGQEICAAEERQGGGFVEYVHEGDGDGEQDQGDHQRGSRLVDLVQQAIQGADHEDEEDGASEFADQAGAEEKFVGQDFLGGGGGVAVDDQFAGDVEQREPGEDGGEQVEGASVAGGFLGGGHGGSSIV